MTDAPTTATTDAALRDRLVDTLTADGVICSPRVERAFRTVPRHLFAPEATAEDAYRPYDAVVTKRDEHGIAVSSVSAPQIQAMMLEQADLAPGMRVLEVGTGGFNAALIAELVGPHGEVTSIDIDPDITDRAVRLLKDTGYGQVRVICADATDGFPERSPYERIIITAGAWDVPPAWRQQLTAEGRLVVPLRLRGLTRSIAFDRAGDRLTSISAHVCGFVPIQGAGEHREALLLVNGNNEIGLRFDDGLPAEPNLLDNVVRTPRAEVWTQVTVGLREPIGTLQLYLATVLAGFCTMAVDPDLDTGVVAPNNPAFSMAAVRGPDFAYLVTRRTPDERSVEYGVHALGPSGHEFADHVAGHVRDWHRLHRDGPGPRIDVVPAGTSEARLSADAVIEKEHSRVALTWPPVDS